MRELRRCPLSGRRVALTWGRLPEVSPAILPPTSPCPLCVDPAPPDRKVLWQDGALWRARVTPDLRPRLGIEGDLEPRIDGIFESHSGLGAHEIVALGRRCTAPPAELPAEVWASGLRAARDRMRDLRRDLRLRALACFLNHGAQAGARLSHPHLQVVALPMLPPALQSTGQLHELRWSRSGRCLSCELLEREERARDRVIAASPGFLAVAAYAPSVPFEIWALPRAHQPAFEAAEDALIEELAGLVSRLLRAAAAALSGCAFNLALYTLPDPPSFHWRLALLPRLAAPGGFEEVSGWASHGLWPEEAAAVFRRLL